jgi:co-chaperonin GroES (HSP10)
MKFQPAKNIVVLKPLKTDDLKAMGIVRNSIIEAAVSKQPQLGQVVQVGDIKKDSELPFRELKSGDVVAYREFGDNKFMLGMEEVVFVVFEDILSILKKE